MIQVTFFPKGVAKFTFIHRGDEAQTPTPMKANQEPSHFTNDGNGAGFGFGDHELKPDLEAILKPALYKNNNNNNNWSDRCYN